MSVQLNTLAAKIWVDDYSGAMPTLTGKEVQKPTWTTDY